MPSIYGKNAALLGKVMDLRLERQNLVVSNIANINIPGYKARSLEFEKELQEAIGSPETRANITRTNAGHVPGRFYVDGFEGGLGKEFKPRTIYGADAVDLDKEMAAMSKNSLMYNALTTVVQKSFEGITKIIGEGGK